MTAHVYAHVCAPVHMIRWWVSWPCHFSYRLYAGWFLGGVISVIDLTRCHFSYRLYAGGFLGGAEETKHHKVTHFTS